jgi:hypothetical protein
MEEINKQLGRMSAHDQKHYRYELSRLDEAQLQRLEELVVRMVKAGAAKPFHWAWSELREGIPQWARFMIISSMYRSAHDVEGNADASVEFGPGTQETYSDMIAALGKEKVQQFLKAYSKGMLYNLLGVFDEGNTDHESDDSWMLVTYDCRQETTGKPIGGLHEDFLEFEQEMEELN